MSRYSIVRTNYNALVDDDGSNTVGTPIVKTTWKDVVLDPVDAVVAPLVTSTTSSATPTPNADTTSHFILTAQAAAAAFANPTGTPVNGQELIIRIKDNGTARALTWGTNYVEGGAPLPSTTLLSKILTIWFVYNTDNALNKWQCVRVAQESAPYVDNSVCDGRLTLTSGTPVTTADVTGAASVYFTPYKGNRIALYDGAAWNHRTFAELTQALGTIVNAQAYDIFAYDNAGVVATEILEWANATVTMTIATPCVVTWTTHGMTTGNSITFTNSGGALPTNVTANTQYWITTIDANTFKLSTSPKNVAAGTFINTSGTQSGTHTGHQPQARATALVLQDGVLVKSGSTTRRYLGTFFTTATTTTEDSLTKRFLWNYYHRDDRTLLRSETSNSWNYSTATWRQTNDNALNQIALIIGYAESTLKLAVSVAAQNNNAAATAMGVGIGEDSTNTPSTRVIGGNGQAPGSLGALIVPLTGSMSARPSVGYHAYMALENGGANATTTFNMRVGVIAGDNNALLSGSINA